MLVFLATQQAPITDNDNLENKPYLCFGLLANLEDILRPVGARLIIFGIFGPFYRSQDGIPKCVLDD